MLRMFTQNFYNLTNFLGDVTIGTWKEVCIRYHIDCLICLESHIFPFMMHPQAP